MFEYIAKFADSKYERFIETYESIQALDLNIYRQPYVIDRVSLPFFEPKHIYFFFLYRQSCAHEVKKFQTLLNTTTTQESFEKTEIQKNKLKRCKASKTSAVKRERKFKHAFETENEHS